MGCYEMALHCILDNGLETQASTSRPSTSSRKAERMRGMWGGIAAKLRRRRASAANRQYEISENQNGRPPGTHPLATIKSQA